MALAVATTRRRVKSRMLWNPTQGAGDGPRSPLGTCTTTGETLSMDDDTDRNDCVQIRLRNNWISVWQHGTVELARPHGKPVVFRYSELVGALLRAGEQIGLKGAP